MSESEIYPGKTVIGLTGNIAVGKSSVMRLLAELGAATIDADQVAHEAILRGTPVFDAILRGFGRGILDENGQINRAALGGIVFNDSAKLRQLEAITHPAIRRRIDQRIRDAAADVVVIEAIKLLEGELKHKVDSIWVVDAAPATQLRRLTRTRGFSDAEAWQRIRAQNSQADKLRQAHVIIDNDGDLSRTRAQVQRAWGALLDRQG